MRLGTLLRRASLNAAILALFSAAPFVGGQATPDSGNAAPTPQTSAPASVPAASPGTNPAADAELPGAIYKDAMHPLDIVRQSLENWSDAELAALHLGMNTAREACDRMNPEDYNKDDLYDLAHLCAFGQDWNPANTAAQRYIVGKAPEHRAQAYAISVGAFVHLNAIDLALATTREMMREPYDAEVAYTVRYMKDYLETVGSPEVFDLARQEHPMIIEALSKGVPLRATYGDAVVSTGLLYGMAMEAAFFEHYAGNKAQAAVDLNDVEQALPPNAALTAEDRQEIDSAKLQYHLLGTELEPIPVIRSLKSATAKTKIDTNFGAPTVFVLFPDWCVQCKKMMPAMTQFETANAPAPIYTYGLTFKQAGETTPPVDMQKELAGTDTMEIAEDTARRFGTTDYPLGIVVDHAGIIRFIGVLPSDAFNSDGCMTKLIARIVGPQAKPAPIRPASPSAAK